MHEGTGKGVWFRLDRPGADPPAAGTVGESTPAEPAHGRAPTRSAPSVSALSALLQIDPERYTDDPLPDFATEPAPRLAR